MQENHIIKKITQMWSMDWFDHFVITIDHMVER